MNYGLEITIRKEDISLARPGGRGTADLGQSRPENLHLGQARSIQCAIPALEGRPYMNYGLEITIRKEDISLALPGGGEAEFLPGTEPLLAEQVTAYRSKKGIVDSRVVIFIAEECIFFKQFELPGTTSDIKEAIGYQLGILTPFTEDAMLHGYTVTRTGEAYQILLVATARQPVESYVQQLTEAGLTIIGIFPASHRYVTKASPKGAWALVLPGQFSKALIFAGARLRDIVLFNGDPDFTELSEISGTETIYHPNPPAGNGRLLNPGQLLSERPLLKEYNLLPPSYRKRDYSKLIITGLLALNLAAFLGLAGGKIYHLFSLEQQVEKKITAVMPEVREVNRTRAAINDLEKKIERISQISGNMDIISLLDNLTKELPTSAYLEMIRLDKRSRAIILQGYTDDIAALTTKLQAMQGAQLKSTSRRRDKTFFQMEIPPP